MLYNYLVDYTPYIIFASMKVVKDLKVDQTKLRTQAAYAKEVGVTRGRINQKVNAGEIPVVEIKGAKLVYVA